MNIKEAIQIVKNIDNMFLTEEEEEAKVIVSSFLEGFFMRNNKTEIKLQRQQDLIKLSNNPYIKAISKKTRRREILIKRQYVMFLLHSKGYSTTEIGKVFDKNHSTVTHSVNLMKTLIVSDKNTIRAVSEVDSELITHNVDLL